MNARVVGIDVGGLGKGLHVVARFEAHWQSCRFGGDDAVARAAEWCVRVGAEAVAVDAPCGWAIAGSFRACERDLRVAGKIVPCFKTPTRERAVGNRFYGWVFEGEKLYRALAPHYRLATAPGPQSGVMLETFPHTVTCALTGRVVRAKPKGATRLAFVTARDAGLAGGRRTARRFPIRRKRATVAGKSGNGRCFWR